MLSRNSSSPKLVRHNGTDTADDFREVCPHCGAKMVPEKLPIHISLAHNKNSTPQQIRSSTAADKSDKPGAKPSQEGQNGSLDRVSTSTTASPSKENKARPATKKSKKQQQKISASSDQPTIPKILPAKKRGILCPLCGKSVLPGMLSQHKENVHGEQMYQPSPYPRYISRQRGKGLVLEIVRG